MILTKKIEEIDFEIIVHQTTFTMAELRYQRDGLMIFIDYLMIYKFL